MAWEVGIVPSILDVNGAFRPNLAIIDGLPVGDGGDGPVIGAKQGAPGVLIVGTNSGRLPTQTRTRV